MQKNIARGAVLLAVGIGSSVTAVSTEGGVPQAFTFATSVLAGACTALGVTSVLVGWCVRRPDEDTES